MKNWLREPPNWFLNVATGAVFGTIALGIGMMIYGVVGLAVLR